MRVDYNPRNHAFSVTLSGEELEKAFQNPSEYLLLLHNIVLETYGREMADKLFPLESEG